MYMRAIKVYLSIVLVAIAFSLTTNVGCKSRGKENASDSLAIRQSMASSPVLSPQEAIKKIHLEKGFSIKLVASEPLITAPVALSFDTKGRIWVVQMNDYMPDTLGTGEDKPTGKVIILSDNNNDGVMDTRKVFLDSLVLPRAICLIEDGILVAEPPNLWYYKIQNDKPFERSLVDSAYAVGGNVEHQANGLLRGLDNWIYNAKSNKRYRKKGDQWLIEKTHFRGQWGISQDDYGRLFYNNNSENLQGDFFMPGLGAINANQKAVEGFNEKIVEDTRVFPIRPTPGVNRGYMEGVLDGNLRLKNFTAACSPVIYNSDLFDKEYYGNAFVAEPSANLIKRNLIQTNEYIVEGEQAYNDKEFLASEDERFRPVSLYNGPDGALYIVDMYRGIIQHKTYLTPYLKNEIKERKLTEPLSCGRIYKIVPQNSTSRKIVIPKDPESLVRLLEDPNGWVRTSAQQGLVDKRDTSVAYQLRNNLKNTQSPLSLIHSLWTMEGLGVLKKEDIWPLLLEKKWPIRMQALAVSPYIINKSNYQEFLLLYKQMISENDTLAAPYIAFITNSFKSFNPNAAHAMQIALARKFGDNVYAADAIISNLQGKEKSFFKEVSLINRDTSFALIRQLKKVISNIETAKNSSSHEALNKQFPKGAAIFQSVCQTCHGSDGNGIKSLAPPLNNSEWVTGNKNKLIPIVLFGLTGPIKIGDKLYESPEINGDMPGIGQNSEFSDEDIAQVLNYVRNSWNNKAPNIMAKDISAIKEKYKGRQKSFTMKELNGLK